MEQIQPTPFISINPVVQETKGEVLTNPNLFTTLLVKQSGQAVKSDKSSKQEEQEKNTMISINLSGAFSIQSPIISTNIVEDVKHAEPDTINQSIVGCKENVVNIIGLPKCLINNGLAVQTIPQVLNITNTVEPQTTDKNISVTNIDSYGEIPLITPQQVKENLDIIKNNLIETPIDTGQAQINEAVIQNKPQTLNASNTVQESQASFDTVNTSVFNNSSENRSFNKANNIISKTEISESAEMKVNNKTLINASEKVVFKPETDIPPKPTAKINHSVTDHQTQQPKTEHLNLLEHLVKANSSTDNFKPIENTDIPYYIRNTVKNQIINHITSKFKGTSQTVEMQLYPKNLGKVNIKMMVESGSLIVEICAASSKTQSILASNADDIKAILSSHLGKEVSVSMPNEERLFDERYQEDRSNHHGGYPQGNQQEDSEKHELDTDEFLNLMNSIRLNSFTERS